MGPLLVIVSPCFRENVIVTYKVVSFLCNLDNFSSEKCNCFLFWKSNFKMALIWKKGYFWPIFQFFSHQGKDTKIPSAHISLTYIHIFCSPYWLFLPSQFCKNCEFIRYGFSLVWLLVLILICAILEQSINNKMVSKI